MAKQLTLFLLVCMLFAVSLAFVSKSVASLSKSSSAGALFALDPKLCEKYPRDFKNIPFGTDYGTGEDLALNKAAEAAKLDFLEAQLMSDLKKALAIKKKPIFTTAEIAGDMVLLDAIHKAGMIDKVEIIFIDTYHLFPESMDFLREIEAHYGFKAKIYAAADCPTQEDFFAKYGEDYWMEDIDAYDMKCKVEPLQRALKEMASDCWINGRRRDHGAERAALPVWEGTKLNPLAFWSFEDCWSYLRRHNVPYHPLHDVGFSSMGDLQSTRKVDHKVWFTYGGERSGRFQGLVNKDGSAKTECGIHTEIKGK